MTADGWKARLVMVPLVYLALAGCALPVDRADGGAGDAGLVSSLSLDLATTASSAPSGEPEAATSSSLAPGDSVWAVSGRATLDGGTSTYALEFVFSVEGDYLLRGSEAEDTIAYCAGDLVLEIANPQMRLRRDGIPPAGPDPDTGFYDLWGPYLRAMTLERLAEGTATRSESTGRAALMWDAAFDAGVDTPARTLAVVMDEETLVPLRLEETWGPTSRYPEGRKETWTITELEVGAVSRDLFRQGLDSGDKPGSDQGFRPIDPAELSTTASYVPPLPTWLPEGFTLASLSYAAVVYPNATDITRYREVFVAVYRRGFYSIAVTTRPPVPGVTAADTVASGAEPYVSDGGAVFQVVAPLRPGRATNARGEIDGLVVTVDGDLTVADLKAILDSIPLQAGG